MNEEQEKALETLMFLVNCYLESLQSGELGEPSIELLSNAGELHAWLESTAKIMPITHEHDSSSGPN